MADESKDKDTVVEALDGISDAIVESFGGGGKPKPSKSVIEALNQIRKIVLESSGGGGKPQPTKGNVSTRPK